MTGSRSMSQDPAQKFRTKIVLLLVFTPRGFDRVHVEEYDEQRKLAYLYRAGPPNQWDATPTSGLPEVKTDSQAKFEGAFSEELGKKLIRLSRSIADALVNSSAVPESEAAQLSRIRDWLSGVATDRQQNDGFTQVVRDIMVHVPPTTKKTTVSSKSAIISIGWHEEPKALKRVGDFETFRQSLTRSCAQSASKKKGIKGEVSGTGHCSICGKANVAVSGLLKIFQPPLYTLDKPGSVAGGFDPSRAWLNFPACRECCDRVDFAWERVKKELTFNFYGFKYLFLPAPVQSMPTVAYEFLDRLVSARISHKDTVRLTAAEDELLYAISQENNLLQVDLLFYHPGPQSFRPALYVSGLLPTRFKKLFEAKAEVDRHPWLTDASPKAFRERQFTFGSLRNVFPAAHGGSTFDDDFLAATRAALELRNSSTRRLLEVGMRWVQDDYMAGKPFQPRLADLFRSILFFEVLSPLGVERSESTMQIDYGDSDQAARVRKVLSQASGKLQCDPAAQASFLVGACCSRIENIQQHLRGASPFSGKLKGFRLKQADVQQLFVAAKEKAAAYGRDEERKVSGLLECAAAALAATPDRWTLSPDEASYFFASATHYGRGLPKRQTKFHRTIQNRALAKS